MSKHGKLNAEQMSDLKGIEPSIVRGVYYYPCSVFTTDGATLERVYIVEEKSYFRAWGVWPEDDKAKKSISISLVKRIFKSPSRLPVNFANELYKKGEFGMGYSVFTVVFKGGIRESYIGYSALDFIQYPIGMGPDDVEDVIPGKKVGALDVTDAPKYYWCLYSLEEK